MAPPELAKGSELVDARRICLPDEDELALELLEWFKDCAGELPVDVSRNRCCCMRCDLSGSYAQSKSSALRRC